MRTLIDFAAFLKKGHIEDFARLQFKIIKEQDIPLLKLITHISEEALLKNSIANLEKTLLDPIINETIMELTRKNSANWEADKLEANFSNRDIQVMDLVGIY